MKFEMNARQMACTCGILLLTLKITTLPSLLYYLCEETGLFVILTLIFLDMMVLSLIIAIKLKFPTLSLYELIAGKLGVVCAKIVYFILILYFCFKLFLVSNESLTYFRNNLNYEMSIVPFLICFLPVISAMAYNGLKGIARTIEFSFIFIVIGIIACLLLTEVKITFSELGPFFNITNTRFFSSIFKISFWCNDYMFLLVVMDRIKLKKEEVKKIYFYVGICIVLLFFLYFAFFKIYKITAFMHKDAISDIVDYRKDVGNITNIEIISILVYTLCMYFQCTIGVYSLFVCLSKLFIKGKKSHFVILFNILFIPLQLFVFHNPLKTIEFTNNYMCYFSILTFVLIPLYLIFLLVFVKRGSYECYKKIYQ